MYIYYTILEINAHIKYSMHDDVVILTGVYKFVFDRGRRNKRHFEKELPPLR